ncbi:MAG: hypothetical protein IPL49_01895 [Saprospirales bacterium]|nr:hypothetical protein [Saprospirales bacterium]
MKRSAFFWKVFLWVFVVAMVVGCQKETLTDPSDQSGLVTQRAPEEKPPVVVTPPPIKVTVPEGASAADIQKAVTDALKEAEKNATDPQKQEKVKAYKAAAGLMTLAEAEKIRVALKDLDGWTFPFIEVYPGNELVVVALSIQVLNPPPPPPENDGILEAHEDGHSLITREIAARCAAKAAKEAKDAGKNGKAQREAIRDKLYELDSKAQEAYESRTDHGGIGTAAEQGLWAQEEANKVITEYLGS